MAISAPKEYIAVVGWQTRGDQKRWHSLSGEVAYTRANFFWFDHRMPGHLRAYIRCTPLHLPYVDNNLPSGPNTKRAWFARPLLIRSSAYAIMNAENVIANNQPQSVWNETQAHLIRWRRIGFEKKNGDDDFPKISRTRCITVRKYTRIWLHTLVSKLPSHA